MAKHYEALQRAEAERRRKVVGAPAPVAAAEWIPVNSPVADGLEIQYAYSPDYFIKDIPPIYSVDEKNLKIDQPRIYYGEKENKFVIVNTKTNERERVII